MPYKAVTKHQCTRRQRQAIQHLKAATGADADRHDDWQVSWIRCKVEKGGVRELSWANNHTTHELAEGGQYTKWSSSTCEVGCKTTRVMRCGCRLVATQLATGERMDVTQSAPP